MVAVVQRSEFFARRRAEPQDGCERQTFTAVDVD
jgi:hypothetical protein